MICLRCRTRCKMISTYHLNIVAAIALFQSLADMVVSQQCGSHYSIFGMMLRRHTFKTLNTSIPLECNRACNDDIRCRSFNYVIKKNVCELNNRAKEARPEDFVPNQHRYYFRRNKEMGEQSFFFILIVIVIIIIINNNNTINTIITIIIAIVIISTRYTSCNIRIQ